jgi:hypothetical protein
VIAAAIVCPFVVFVVVHDSTFLDKGPSQRALGLRDFLFIYSARGMKILIIVIIVMYRLKYETMRYYGEIFGENKSGGQRTPR